LLSYLVGYAFGLINKCCDNDRLNCADDSVGILLLIICVMSILVIVLINVVSLDYNVITTCSCVVSL
jgi:hypothetical protein